MQTCSALGRGIADCAEIAGKFRSTCASGPVTNILSEQGEAVTCDNTGSCPGTLSGTTCTWQRKLCVTCSDASGAVRIRIQSNGLPGSCFKTPLQTDLKEFDIDFEVAFNALPTSTVNPDTQDAVNTLLCESSTQNSDVPSAYLFDSKGTASLQGVSGIALDGVVYQNQIGVNGVDPFYPAVYGSVTDPASAVTKVDLCLGRPGGEGMYNYKSMSPCVAKPGSQEAGECGSGCDVATQSVVGYEKELTVIGIAKDGHVLYGPYLSGGEKAGGAGLDVCNGAVGLLDGDCESYAYFATDTFPYLIGCFGAGNRPSYTPQCSARTQPFTDLTTKCTDAPTPSPPTVTPATLPPTTFPPSTDATLTMSPLTDLPTTVAPTAMPTALPMGSTLAPATEAPLTETPGVVKETVPPTALPVGATALPETESPIAVTGLPVGMTVAPQTEVPRTAGPTQGPPSDAPTALPMGSTYEPTEAASTEMPMGVTYGPTAEPTALPDGATYVPVVTGVPGASQVPTASPTGLPEGATYGPTAVPTALPDGESFAPTVGSTPSPLTAMPVPGGETPAPPVAAAGDSSSSDGGSDFPWWIIVVGGAVLLLFGGCGAFYVTSQRQAKDERDMPLKEVAELNELYSPKQADMARSYQLSLTV